MLSNAYFLAKFRFDTAENEPAKNLQNFANFPSFSAKNDLRCNFHRATGSEVQLLAVEGVHKLLERGLYVPGELPLMIHQKPVRLLVCPSNVGARELADELRGKAIEAQPELTFEIGESSPTKEAASSHMLLYLNDRSFEDGEDGALARFV